MMANDILLTRNHALILTELRNRDFVDLDAVIALTGTTGRTPLRYMEELQARGFVRKSQDANNKTVWVRA